MRTSANKAVYRYRYDISTGMYHPVSIVCPTAINRTRLRLACLAAITLELIEDLGPGVLLLLNRGYAIFELLEKLVHLGVDFLVRLPDNGLFRPITEFIAQGESEWQGNPLPFG